MFTEATTYAFASHATAVNAQPQYLLGCYNLCIFPKVHETAFLLTSSLVLRLALMQLLCSLIDLPNTTICPNYNKVHCTNWAELFMQHVLCNHGCPLEVVSGRGAQFAGNCTHSLADPLRITWNMATACHPDKTDGQTEWTNCTVEDMLRWLVSPTMLTWGKLLVNAQFAIQQCLAGICAPLPSILGHQWELHLRALFLHRVGILPLQRLHCVALHTCSCKDCMLVAQQRQNFSYSDRRHMPANIAVGSDVLLATTILHLKTSWLMQADTQMAWTSQSDGLRGISWLDLPACMHHIHIIFLIDQYRSDERPRPPQPPELMKNLPE